eukprot:1186260-Prorocentrum_minimum.AAC.3
MSGEASVDATVLAAKRKVCHQARDNYFACVEASTEDKGKCQKLRAEFESTCPAVWVKHFEQRRADQRRIKRMIESSAPNIPPSKS